MKTLFDVHIDDQSETYETLDEAIKVLKHLTGKITVDALLASQAGNEKLRLKNLKLRDSIQLKIRMEVNG